ncbi:MAG: type II toxin-antitoxin system VapB family antitoxin [Acidobacteriota bacterium]
MFIIINCENKLIKRRFMRTTVTIEKDIIDELLKETKSKNKSSAVRKAINEYLRKKKIEKIKSMKGKLEFVLTAEEMRHYER